MTRKASPHNQNTVPVIDPDGKPLAPTKPSRARRWIESGKAAKEWKHGIFAVRLTSHLQEVVTPEISLNIDPGAKSTGIAVVVRQPNNETTAIAGFEIRHRGDQISRRMTARRGHRQNRRSRLRRRPARFLNRTRKEGWLPPSVLSKLSNITTAVRHLRDLFPVSGIVIETNRFDPRLLRDPQVAGADYQHSERGHMQVREYVLQRDQRTCQYHQKCKGGKAKKLEVDHIVPRSKGGAYRIDNLITACKPCNDAKSNHDIEDFLAKDPDRLKRVRQQLKKPMASATHMNQLVPLLQTALDNTGLPVTETDAVSTAHTRNELGIPKSHVNDALCLAEPLKVNNLPERLTLINAVGHGKRQMLSNPSRYGTPRYKKGPTGKQSPYRAYCRMPRTRQGFTTTPEHKLRQRRSQGITSGDHVSYQHPKDGKVQGYAALANRNSRVAAGKNKSVKTDQVTLLNRANGYRLSTIQNTADRNKK